MVIDSPTHKIAYAKLDRPVKSGMVTYRWLCFKHNKTNGVTRTYLCSRLSKNDLPVPGRYVTEQRHAEPDFMAMSLAANAEMM